MKILSLPSWIRSLRIVRIIRKLAFQASWLNASIANNANIALYSVFHFFSGVSSLQHQKRLVSLQQNSRANPMLPHQPFAKRRMALADVRKRLFFNSLFYAFVWIYSCLHCALCNCLLNKADLSSKRLSTLN